MRLSSTISRRIIPLEDGKVKKRNRSREQPKGKNSGRYAARPRSAYKNLSTGMEPF
jgi:hypothetical protein